MTKEEIKKIINTLYSLLAEQNELEIQIKEGE